MNHKIFSIVLISIFLVNVYVNSAYSLRPPGAALTNIKQKEESGKIGDKIIKKKGKVLTKEEYDRLDKKWGDLSSTELEKMGLGNYALLREEMVEGERILIERIMKGEKELNPEPETSKYSMKSRIYRTNKRWFKQDEVRKEYELRQKILTAKNIPLSVESILLVKIDARSGEFEKALKKFLEIRQLPPEAIAKNFWQEFVLKPRERGRRGKLADYLGEKRKSLIKKLKEGGLGPKIAELMSYKLIITASRMELLLFNDKEIVMELAKLMKSEGLNEKLVKRVSDHIGHNYINKILDKSAKRIKTVNPDSGIKYVSLIKEEVKAVAVVEKNVKDILVPKGKEIEEEEKKTKEVVSPNPKFEDILKEEGISTTKLSSWKYLKDFVPIYGLGYDLGRTKLFIEKLKELVITEKSEIKKIELFSYQNNLYFPKSIILRLAQENLLEEIFEIVSIPSLYDEVPKIKRMKRQQLTNDTLNREIFDSQGLLRIYLSEWKKQRSLPVILWGRKAFKFRSSRTIAQQYIPMFNFVLPVALLFFAIDSSTVGGIFTVVSTVAMIYMSVAERTSIDYSFPMEIFNKWSYGIGNIYRSI